MCETSWTMKCFVAENIFFLVDLHQNAMYNRWKFLGSVLNKRKFPCVQFISDFDRITYLIKAFTASLACEVPVISDSWFKKFLESVSKRCGRAVRRKNGSMSLPINFQCFGKIIHALAVEKVTAHVSYARPPGGKTSIWFPLTNPLNYFMDEAFSVTQKAVKYPTVDGLPVQTEEEVVCS